MKSAKIIAIANQKGGVGKTTTTLSIGVALAKENKKVLLVDADPQGNLTTSLGYYEQEDMPVTLADLMYAEIMDKEIKIHDAILHHEEKIDLIPSDISLSAIELSLGNAMSREFILKNCLNTVKNEYDYILIDCMPSLGLIPINCLACSNEIIIPVQSQYLAMRGMTYLFETVSKVRRTINPNLRVKGILLTLVDRRANLSKNVRQELDKNYGKYVKIYDTEIPLAIKTAEASIRGKSIFEYDKELEERKLRKAEYEAGVADGIKTATENIKREDALSLVDLGLSVEQIATALKIDLKTIQKWIEQNPQS